MKSKPFLLIYIIILSAITYWAYPIITARYFSDDSKNEKEITSSQNDCADGELCEIGTENIFDTKENNDTDKNSEEIPTDANNHNAFLEINHSDCDSECQYFEIEKEKNYCLQVCGLNTSVSTPTSTIDDCESLNGLDKDYCWKNEAVEKTDFSICKKIKDSKIKEVCENRITEDIIDEL